MSNVATGGSFMLKYLQQVGRNFDMNKEFMILSDGNVAVTDENGHISKITYCDNSQELLLSENKIEIIDNRLKKLNDELHNQQGVVSLSKKMLIAQPIVMLLITLGMFVYGGLSSSGEFLTYALLNGVKGFVYSSIICGTSAIYNGIVKSIYKKKVSKTNSEIAIAQKLKECSEKELSDIKKRQKTIESPTISMNEPVSLIEQTNTMETQIADEINSVCTESLNQQQKKLILRRKNRKY